MKGELLHTIQQRMPQSSPFTAKEIWSDLVRSKGEPIPYASVLWCLHHLYKSEIIEKVSRGIYYSTPKMRFTIEVSDEMTRLSEHIRVQFPFINYAMWSSKSISKLMHHIAINNSVLIDVERDVLDSVFENIKGEFPNVFLNPDTAFLNRYVDYSQHPIIIRPLVTESPLDKSEDIPIPTFEKILVDISFDEVFSYLEGSELQHILSNAQSYSIDRAKLLRYATRKNRRKQMEDLLSNLPKL